MSKTYNLVFAGFGGQGVLFSAKLLAYAGMIQGKEVSWLPSYGPEMRGGTANTSVVISDEPVSWPQVLNPDLLVALNQPSFDKFIDSVVPGGTVIADSSLIQVQTKRKDITIVGVPATSMAQHNDMSGLANMIALGALLKASGVMDMDTMKAAIEKNVPAKKAHLLGKNMQALELGYNYQGE